MGIFISKEEKAKCQKQKEEEEKEQAEKRQKLIVSIILTIMDRVNKGGLYELRRKADYIYSMDYYRTYISNYGFDLILKALYNEGIVYTSERDEPSGSGYIVYYTITYRFFRYNKDEQKKLEKKIL